MNASFWKGSFLPSPSAAVHGAFDEGSAAPNFMEAWASFSMVLVTVQFSHVLYEVVVADLVVASAESSARAAISSACSSPTIQWHIEYFLWGYIINFYF